jgi:hypothetical protein
MSAKRMHRGPHPADLEAFSPAVQPRLAEAMEDLARMLDHSAPPPPR